MRARTGLVNHWSLRHSSRKWLFKLSKNAFCVGFLGSRIGPGRAHPLLHFASMRNLSSVSWVLQLSSFRHGCTWTETVCLGPTSKRQEVLSRAFSRDNHIATQALVPTPVVRPVGHLSDRPVLLRPPDLGLPVLVQKRRLGNLRGKSGPRPVPIVCGTPRTHITASRHPNDCGAAR